MEVTMSSLLKADEEKIRSQLKADEAFDQDRRQSEARLKETLDRMLLRYNAACTDDPMRQAAADCQAAAMRDMLELLSAGIAQKEISKRRFRTGGVIALLVAVIFGLTGALTVRDYFPVGCALFVLSALSGFLAGRLWYGEREVRVRAGLDADAVWRTLKKTADTVDRKTEEFLDLSRGWRQSAAAGASAAPAGAAVPDAESLKLMGSLLEALYAQNGDFALRQLKLLLPWLKQQGIEAVDYTPDTAELFEVLPTKQGTATLRPALVADGKLLQSGRAAEHI